MLLQTIDQDLKTAMKEKDEVTLAALRNLKAALKNTEIEKQHELSDEEVLAVMARQVKRQKDSITEFEKGGRADLVANEKSQMAVLEKYLPKQMDDAAVLALVNTVIKDLSATPADFGKVMKEVLVRAKGQTDGTVVSKLVKETLK